MPASPNVLNYAILKGDLYFTPEGGVERHLGNAPLLQIQPNITKLDHFSSRDGSGSKDRSITQRKEATVTLNLDEITPENLSLALFGTAALNSDGDMEFDIMSEDEVVGALRLEGTNDVGNRFRVVVDRVSFVPSDPIDFISEEIAVIALEGECLKVGNNPGFGTITEIRDAPTT